MHHLSGPLHSGSWSDLAACATRHRFGRRAQVVKGQHAVLPFVNPKLPNIHTTHMLQPFVKLLGRFCVLHVCVTNVVFASGLAGAARYSGRAAGDKVIGHLMRSGGSRYFVGVLSCRASR